MPGESRAVSDVQWSADASQRDLPLAGPSPGATIFNPRMRVYKAWGSCIGYPLWRS